jgi:SAM-dependent methyltransferase
MQYDRAYFQGRRSFFYSLGGYRDVASYFNRLARWFLPHAGEGALLDLGCAYGFLLARFNNGRALSGCDVSAWAISQAAARLPNVDFAVLAADGRLPYPSGRFSAVLCTDVLEHVGRDDQQVLLDEVARVLASGASLCMTTPNLNPVRRWLYSRADRREAHIGMRHLEEWTGLLAQHGLRVVRSWTYLHGFLPGRFRTHWMPECALVARKDS